MESITLAVISIATLLNAILTIVNFVVKSRQAGKNVIDKKFQEALSPLRKEN